MTIDIKFNKNKKNSLVKCLKYKCMSLNHRNGVNLTFNSENQ